MKSKTFNIVSSKGPKGVTVILEGDLGIKNTEAVRNALMALKLNSDSVTFHLKNVEKLDITSIQNIRALKNNLVSQGRKVTVNAELPPEIERLLKNTGFENTL